MYMRAHQNFHLEIMHMPALFPSDLLQSLTMYSISTRLSRSSTRLSPNCSAVTSSRASQPTMKVDARRGTQGPY